MNIAFLTSADSWHVPIRTKYFIKKGYNVFYYGIKPGGDRPIRPQGVKYFEIASNHRYLGFINKAKQISKLTQKHQIDILHIMGMGQSVFAPFANVKKIVIENNGSDVLVAPKKQPFRKLIYKFMYKYANGVVQDSKISRQAGIQLGAPEKNNVIIELGIDFDIFNFDVKKGEARKKLGIEKEKIVFSPRGFTELYNITTIIKSIPYVKKVYPDVKFVFCRHFGELGDKYQQLADSLRVTNNIIFTGYLDNEKEMPCYHKDADLTVSIPSSDSSPRSVYESMACGTPVIISELPWYYGKFVAGKDLVTISDINGEMLSKAILDVLTSTLKVDIKNAYNYVKQHIDMNDHSKLMEDLYQRLLYK